ncbi:MULTISPECIES: peptidase M48, Ste24p [unclassified Pseudomonas]|uniref:peptidase M48, Ste24p n=1 Tax=unclassified Pseudomonas TaxID=196821 RepID=UPI000CD2D96F|nr:MULTISPECIES: peptidase M48, Ste24p [unclassified Pseudomonas]POA52116.1 peptidase M48, Ste24p [Pseudomonas sp. FW507-12TSA]
MAEPTSTAASVVLGKYGLVMAAFIGSILSLGFLKDLTRFQAATAVATGFGFSVYLTQPVTAWLAPKLELAVTDDLLCGVAFVLGLTAMNIIPAIKAAMGSFVTARGA